MKPRVTLILACLAACQFDVNVGPRDAGPGPDAGPTMLDEFCPEPAKYQAYEVRLDPTPVDTPGCWNGGIVPADHTLPAETFQVLIASTNTFLGGVGGGAGGGVGTTASLVNQDVTLAINGLGAQKLGDAPLIKVGPATAGFEWQSTLVSAASTLSRQERLTTARFAFDRLDLPNTAGQLTLEARWTCVHSGGDCEVPTDSQWCAVNRTFVAQKLAVVPEGWTVPTTALLEGATPYLVSVDLGALSRPTLACPAAGLEQYELTPTLRSLEVWQLAPFQLRVPARTFDFAGAPTVELSSDFGNGTQFERTQLHGEDRALDSTTRERRTSVATLNGRSCGAFMVDGGSSVRPAELVLESTYECTGDNCGTSTATDRGNCRVVVPWLSLRLP